MGSTVDKSGVYRPKLRVENLISVMTKTMFVALTVKYVKKI